MTMKYQIISNNVVQEGSSPVVDKGTRLATPPNSGNTFIFIQDIYKYTLIFQI